MIKNVIFDIGNVLVHFRFREYMQELNMTDEQIEALAAHMIFNGSSLILSIKAAV